MYTALGNVFADIVITQSESEDKDAKIARLESRIKELEAKLIKPVKVSTTTVEWYTPAPYIVMAREVLGSIDLDPASNALAQSWIQAEKIYTKEDNGLEQKWAYNVFCNPPYGRSVEEWLNKAIDGYQWGDISACIMLLNRTGAAWYKKRKREVTAICEVDRRIAFLDESGKLQSSPRYYNDFIYLGKRPDKFESVFSAIGDVRIINL
jgi:hypothetical protein